MSYREREKARERERDRESARTKRENTGEREKERMKRKTNAKEGDVMVESAGEIPREKRREQGGVRERKETIIRAAFSQPVCIL